MIILRLQNHIFSIQTIKKKQLLEFYHLNFHFDMNLLTLKKNIPFVLLAAIAMGGVFIPSLPAFNDGGKYNSSDIAWIIVASALVFLMTPGLAFFLWWHGSPKKCSFYHD